MANPKDIIELMKGLGLIGPTGDHPEGKMRPDDEGGIGVAVSREGDNVILTFGKPVNWIGLHKSQVVAVCSAMLNQAGVKFTIE